MIDSSDFDLVTKKASNWLHNLKKRVAPDLKYILVPELHADHLHWHIHGLLADCPELTLHKTDIVKNGKVIYNLDNWKYGFSTVTKVEHTGKVSGYIVKYISKELCEMTKGRRRYWASKNCLKAENVMEIDTLTTEQLDSYIRDISPDIEYMKTLVCAKSGQKVKYIEVGV